MTHCIADYIASSAAGCGLAPSTKLSSYVVAEEGYCVAVRALEDKARYNQLEDADGAFHTIRAGDVLVGALGERRALKGYSGCVPRRIQAGDTLHVLNMGGIIGRCTSDHPDLGPALPVEVLGAVQVEESGQWRHACIQDYAIAPAQTLTEAAPLVMVSGSSMDTGKTYAACQIIQALTERGLRVAAAKLTGAALLRDVRAMREHGATATATFTDAGIVASTGADMRAPAKGLIAHLSAGAPDALVLELGDGFVGYYGVDGLLRDRELQRFTAAHVVAATDLAGAWAAERFFREDFRAPITALTGPVTDNAVGREYIQHALGVPAVNAQQDAAALTDLVAATLGCGPEYGRTSGGREERAEVVRSPTRPSAHTPTLP